MELSQPREAEVALLKSIEIYRDLTPAGHPDMAAGQIVSIANAHVNIK